MMPRFLPVGDHPARPFAMPARAWARAIAANAGFAAAEAADEEPHGATNASLEHAGAEGLLVHDQRYALDPAWLRHLGQRPGAVLTWGGRPVLAHLAGGAALAPLRAAMAGEAPLGPGWDVIAADDPDTRLENAELRKRERPFLLAYDEAGEAGVERAAYDASYKGVTDALTLFVWRRPAFHLTRLAARAGLSPNQVTFVGFLLCVAAFFAFEAGQFALGALAGFVFMVLDTVDGKLARCTGQSSKWGNIFDHGVDLVHPPFWYGAWIVGLPAVGRGLEPVYATTLFALIVAGYVAQRVIEGLFIRRFGIHIHVWRPFDSRFRLVTARRNPNMALLIASLLVGRPDWGIQWVALWTLLSFLVHAVRLAQANARADRGHAVTSWLA